MKTFTKIFLSIIIASVLWSSLLAQEDISNDSIKESEEITTGHVFVDGKYIEPPYIVRRVGWKIFINDILVFDYQKPRSPYNFTEKPKANFEELDKTSGLSEIFEIKDTAYNVPLATVISFYYLEKYEYSAACDSIVAFHRTIPNVQSFTKLGGADDTFEMASFNNESRVISLQPYGRKHNQDFGPNQNTEREKEINRGVTSTFNDYCRDLSLGNLLIYYKSEGGHGSFQRVRIKSLKIKDFCNILISEDSQNQKVELLTNIVIDRAFAEKVVATFLNKSILIRILEQSSSVINKTGEKKCTIETSKDYVPNKGALMAWCPNIYEAEFQYFLSDEIALVRDEIEGQGYVFDVNNIFIDPTYNDHNFGTCTYANLKKMASAGFLYISSHGYDGVESDSEGNAPPAGISVLYSDSESDLNDWKEGDPNILIYQLYNYWFGECWTAIAT